MEGKEEKHKEQGSGFGSTGEPLLRALLSLLELLFLGVGAPNVRQPLALLQECLLLPLLLLSS